MKIDELDFSVRTYNALKRAKIETVEQLRQKTDDDLYKIRNLGMRSIEEIRSKLAYTPSNADRIRSMNDEELAALLRNEDPGYCKNLPKCIEALSTEDGIPDAWCLQCIQNWLRQPAEQKPPATMAEEEKQHSGLIEED